ncbi:hypothetical protein CDD83_3194 [Cordyceps sp. RAO-2017]|nr:hypothetical protein CDD83_3194 [Cordyceps sp. RAO-2017]
MDGSIACVDDSSRLATATCSPRSPCDAPPTPSPGLAPQSGLRWTQRPRRASPARSGRSQQRGRKARPAAVWAASHSAVPAAKLSVALRGPCLVGRDCSELGAESARNAASEPWILRAVPSL